MEFHSDPSAYGPTDCIASLSLGADRDFSFRSVENHSDIHTIALASGSLLIMGEHCQDRYEHAVPRCPGCTEPRLNITFRKFGWGEE